MEDERNNLRNNNFNFGFINSKYPGTGNPNTDKLKFESNVQKDLCCSHITHKSRLTYISVALNQHNEITRVQLLDKMAYLSNGMS